MVKKRIYSLEQNDLDVLRKHYKSKGLSSTNQSVVKIAVESLVETIKRENDESRR